VTQKKDIAIVGATGAVGRMFIEILEQRDFPVENLYPLASERSEGEVIQFKGRSHRVKNLESFDFSQAQIAFFSAGSAVAAQYAPKAAAAGCIVIDNSSQFRYEPDVPLVVPEVNEHALADYRHRNIIANPNCSTIQMVVALKPIYDRVGIRRIHVATYQSVSGAGHQAVEELARQTAGLLNGQPAVSKVFPQQIAFNVLPHIDVFLDNGYTKEEMKIVWETRKILEDDRIEVNPTAVRVPVFYAHSEAVAIETEQPITAAEAVELLKHASGVSVVTGHDYPTPLTVANQDNVFVGRIRNDLTNPNGLNLWIVGDNIRKGAALNGVQIAEHLLKAGFVSREPSF
jgi:aspartate-semialdehyde dehydrogenase